MGKRTRARECAFQILYQWDVTREPMDRVCGLYWQVRTTTEETRARAEQLARGTARAAGELDAKITAAAHNWRFDRIAGVDKSILRMAAYELAHEPHTPASVVIDEAVELAKRFGEKDSPAFVNGVLDAVRRALAGEGPAERKPRRPRTRT